MFKKILVPSDGSDLAHKAADFAADLAKVHGAQIIGVYVIDPFPYIGIGDASAVGLQAYLSEAKLAANRSLEMLADSCKQRGVSYAGDTIERSVVYEGITETARIEACDLIVMGSHGRQGVEALILGSVAQKVLTHAKVPVLIVKG
ncbi:universal stress protein [Hydrogenophaga sp. OTU3427]|uniref:universal stress protein n=1 Tax=Hydrogenophaga sp. OTU3427 TaxID=3043856 RepID=UPI00313C3935